MKFIKNKSFNAIIITKKKMMLGVCIFMLTLVFAFLLGYNKPPTPAQNQYTSSDGFHGAIIANELHQESYDKEI